VFSAFLKNAPDVIPTCPMTYRRLVPALFLTVASLLTLPSIWAQGVSAPAADAAMLAKYDRNHNGVIDADERAAMNTEQKKLESSLAREASSASDATGEVVTISPFEVVADTKGPAPASTRSSRTSPRP
jgi:hypothetical protein